MSWVQNNAPPPTLPHQQQKIQAPSVAPHQEQQPLNMPQHQQQQLLATHPSLAQVKTAAVSNANASPSPQTLPPLAMASINSSTSGAYLTKPGSTNNNVYQPQQHNSVRSQMETNGATTNQQQQQPGHYVLPQQPQQPPAASNSWPQQAYLQTNQMMQANAAAANNNWQQQQQQQPPQHVNNLYASQQKHTNATHNIWQPPELQTTPSINNVPTQQLQQQSHQQQQQAYPHSTTFDNYFTANQTTATLQQQQQPPPPQVSQQTLYPHPPLPSSQQRTATDTANYFQYQKQPSHQQTQSTTADLFENNINANKGDGWGDWDWNDNGNVIGSEVEHAPNMAKQPPHPAQLPIQKPPVQQLQNAFESHATNYAASTANVIEDSFATQATDNWNWNLGDDDNANVNVSENSVVAVDKQLTTIIPAATLPPQVPTTVSNRQAATQVPRQVANSVQVPQQKAAEFAVTDAEGLKAAAAANIAKPSSLPLSEVTNENYNTSATPLSSGGIANSSNIPNSVYVSQAKPVSRPSRQYASPPGVASPTSEPLDNALTPPQAFQNETTTSQQQPDVAASSVTSTAAVNAPPPAMPPSGVGVAAAANPFKRAGAAQHHRSTGLMTTINNANFPTPPAPPTPQQFSATAVATAFAVPPPPADFANPLNNHLEPDNSEILHENQEVLGMPLGHNTQPISLPGAEAHAPLPPPPNDERNQYLQTSPLSENPDEDLNLETDSLPPPGLSRLVLGQPELLEATQRTVTGTEEPANMHLDERLADGEDTSLELVQTVPLMNALQRSSSSGAGSSSSGNNSNTIDITTDRNLYLVPGESNVSNEPRVVTGVERSPASNAPASPPQTASGQREIELDGENIEDQQQEQHHTAPLLTVNSRDEPPLEGAAASVEPQPLSTDDNQDAHHQHPLHHHHQAQTQHYHHQHQQQSSKSNASTGNDESDPMPAHQRQHHHSTRYTGAGNNKSRKHSTDELERNISERPQQQVRRDKQRSSVDRYESDLDESEPYSSDRERERERRRAYREGSVRSDRDREEREYAKEKRRRAGERAEKRDERSAGEREKVRDKYYARDSGKSDTQRRSDGRHKRQYEEDIDDLSTRRKEQTRRSGGRHHHSDERGGAGRSDRSEREYDDYNRRHRGSTKRGEKINDDPRDIRRSTYVDDERREQRRTRRERGSDYDTLERRHRGTGGDKLSRGERDRGDPREYDEYRKQSSRNARESDLEKERARYDPRNAAAVSMYGYPPYNYDPYASYYYEQMARTNPQAYAEWYKKYYSHATAAAHQGISAHAASAATAAGGDHGSLNSSSLAAATADGRESVHSGRSSVQNDKERSGHLSLRDADVIAEPDPQRLTPRKFVNEHAIVSLSAGILVTVKPKYTSHGAISNIVKLQRLGANDATRQLFQAYPGPLVRGLTHKKTIIEFCEDQIRLGPMETTIYAKQLVCNNIEKYRGSYTLMWQLLILLLRQNGMVVGTDIAELLLKNQQQFPYEAVENTEGDGDGDSSALSGDEEVVQDKQVIDAVASEQDVSKHGSGNAVEEKAASAPKQILKTSSTISNPPGLTDAEITDKFRNYLLYGNVNEALDWATDNNLWGHALFLASKVDRRSHANVMMKFANKLSLNDPLQTLYQLMSGRQPSSVTSVQDERWGDWRPHLSMVLSNTSQKPELDRKSITTLGDSLFNRGDLYAAHFCYLMAQLGFGRYQESATQETTLQQHLPKLVLLGSSHYKSFNDFATNEAIMMTEIYEYACSLNDDKFSLVEFQPYKYILATRLLDYGYNLRSLMYFEQIALHIQADPSKYESSFINKIYEFADRLKYYDPVLERSMDDQQQPVDGNLNNSQLANFEEQKWLQDLRSIAVQHKVECSAGGQIAETQSQIDQQFVELNKQFNELNMQYNSLGNVEQTPTFYNPETLQQQQQQQQQQHTDPSADHYNQQQKQQQAAQSVEQEAAPTADVSDAYGYYNQQQQQQQQYMQPTEVQQQQQHEPHSIPYYDPNQQQSHQQHYQGYGAEALDAQNNAATYDYWSQQQQQLQSQPHAGYDDEYEHATRDDEEDDDDDEPTTRTRALRKSTLQDIAGRVEATIKSVESVELQQQQTPAMATAAATKTNIFKTQLESVRKLQQQGDLPSGITAAAAKLYNSYDGPQTRVAQKPNTNHNNNNNNINTSNNLKQQQQTQQRQQQQHLANLATSFLSTPPEVSKYSNDVQKLQQQTLPPQPQTQTQQKLQPQQSNVINAKLKNSLSPNSKAISSSNSQASATVKRVNFDLPQRVEDKDAAVQGARDLSTTANQISSSDSSRNSSDRKNSSSSRVEKLGLSNVTSNATKTLHNKTLDTYRRSSNSGNNASAVETAKPLATNDSNRNAVNKSKYPAHFANISPRKHIVYNGTYPIDLPLESRFTALERDYDPEANAQTARLKYAHMLNEYDLDTRDMLDDVAEEDEDDDEDEVDDDDDYIDDDEDDLFTADIVDGSLPYDIEEFLGAQSRPRRQQRSLLSRLGIIRQTSSTTKSGGSVGASVQHTTNHHAVWSMQELIANPSIPLNYQKMCHEVEQSLTSFEKYLDSKTFEQERKAQQQSVRTYDIDRPIDEAQDKKYI